MVLVEEAVAALLEARGQHVSAFARVLPKGWSEADIAPHGLSRARVFVLADREPARLEEVVRRVAQQNSAANIYLATARPADGALSRLARAGLHDFFDVRIDDERQRLVDTMRVHAEADALWPPGLMADIGDGLERRAVEFCLRNGKRHLSVEHVAEWLGKKRRTLERRVEKRTGHTIAYWLNEGRAAYAVARHESSLSYTQIAHEMGYASGSSVGMLIGRARVRRDGSSHT